MIRSGLSALAIASSLAAPTDWNGVFTEPMYGGNMNVCVSQTASGDYYGQAVISTLGYMRGLIDPSTSQWTGDYYMMGQSTVKGTFALDLIISSNIVYEATWTQDPSLSFSTTGTQTSSVTPDDVSCFRVDNDMLTGDVDFSFTGSWLNSEGTFEEAVGTGSDYFGSYVYEWEDGTIANGYMQGPLWQNGQISNHDWFESEDTMGLEITVGKNATAYYLMWWYIDDLASFDISLINEDDMHAQTLYWKTGSAYDLADDQYCLILKTASQEEACQESTGSCGDEDDEDEDSSPMQGAILAFGVMNFAAIVVLGFVLLARLSPTATSGSQDTPKDTELADSKNAMH